MTTEASKPDRRLPTKYSAAERERLIEQQRASGLSKKAFCRHRSINLGTFYGWTKRMAAASPSFAKVEMMLPAAAPIEVELPNGVQILVRTSGDVDQTARLIRQVIAPERS